MYQQTSQKDHLIYTIANMSHFTSSTTLFWANAHCQKISINKLSKNVTRFIGRVTPLIHNTIIDFLKCTLQKYNWILFFFRKSCNCNWVCCQQKHLIEDVSNNVVNNFVLKWESFFFVSDENWVKKKTEASQSVSAAANGDAWTIIPFRSTPPYFHRSQFPIPHPSSLYFGLFYIFSNILYIECLSYSHFLSRIHSNTHTLTHSHTHTLAHSHTQIHTHSHTRTLTHASFSLFFSTNLCWRWI